MLEILDTAGTVSVGEVERGGGGRGRGVGSDDLQCLSPPHDLIFMTLT